MPHLTKLKVNTRRNYQRVTLRECYEKSAENKENLCDCGCVRVSVCMQI